MRTYTQILLALMLLLPLTAASQDYVPTPVTISKEKVKVDGKLYYSHIVLEKQTVFSICKAYDIGEEELYAANPSIREKGLKKNAIILIPVKSSSEPASAGQKGGVKSTPAATTNDKPEKADKAAIVAQIAQQVEPQVQKQDPPKKDKKDKKSRSDFFYHVVKWYEDIQGIAKQYEMTVEALMAFNELDEAKVTGRQKLKIPSDPQAYMAKFTPSEEISAKEFTAMPEAAFEEPASEEVVQQEEEATIDLRGRKVIDAIRGIINRATIRKVEMTLVLPFAASSDRPSDHSFEFYCGALLAARDLGLEGCCIELNAYDSKDGAWTIPQEDLRKSDIIIGPNSIDELKSVLYRANGTMVVSPLERRADTLSRHFSNFIQAPTPVQMQYEDISRWVLEDYQEGDNIIILYEKGGKSNTSLATCQRMLYGKYRDYKYNIIEHSSKDIESALAALMSESNENRVIIACENEAFVNDAMRVLNLLIHDKDLSITVYQGSKILSFNTIDVQNLHNTKLHCSLGYYIDYDDERTKQFLLKYRGLVGAEPSTYSFQGYDLTYYLCTLISIYGDSWKDHIDSGTGMLQSTFNFERSGAGYVNTGLRRIVYGPKYSITIVDPSF